MTEVNKDCFFHYLRRLYI